MSYLIAFGGIMAVIYGLARVIGYFENKRVMRERDDHVANLKKYDMACRCKTQTNVAHIDSLPYGRRIDDGQQHEWDD